MQEIGYIKLELEAQNAQVREAARIGALAYAEALDKFDKLRARQIREMVKDSEHADQALSYVYGILSANEESDEPEEFTPKEVVTMLVRATGMPEHQIRHGIKLLRIRGRAFINTCGYLKLVPALQS